MCLKKNGVIIVMEKKVKKNVFQIGNENVCDEKDVSSIMENMQNIDNFDLSLVHKQ